MRFVCSGGVRSRIHSNGRNPKYLAVFEGVGVGKAVVCGTGVLHPSQTSREPKNDKRRERADKAHLLKLAEEWLDLANLTHRQSGQRVRKILEHPVRAKLGARNQRAA
jgi:hypothetical protein